MKGFIPHIIENTETEALYHIDATASATYKIGEALIMSSNKAVIDNNASFPKWLCRTNVTLGSSGGVIAVTPPREDIIYETEVGPDAGLTSAAAGTAVDIHTDGMTVADLGSQSAGSFEIVWAAGTAQGSKVLVRVLK